MSGVNLLTLPSDPDPKRGVVPHPGSWRAIGGFPLPEPVRTCREANSFAESRGFPEPSYCPQAGNVDDDIYGPSAGCLASMLVLS